MQRKKNGVTLYNAGLIIVAIFLAVTAAANRKEQVSKRKEVLLRELSQAKSVMSAQPEGLHWEQVVEDGFGDLRNDYVWAMSSFTDIQGSEWIYAGTLNSYRWEKGAQVWRSATGEPGSFEYVRAFPGCEGVRGATTYKGLLWLGTANILKPGKCNIWVTDGTSWKLANRPGFGIGAKSTRGIVVYRGELYADAGAGSSLGFSAKIFKYTGTIEEGNLDSINSASWECVSPEWQAPVNSIGEIREFKGDLYIGTWAIGTAAAALSDMSKDIDSLLGADVYRYQGDDEAWERVVSNGFGDPKNGAILSSAVFKDYLYVGTMNARPGTNGGEVPLHLDGAEVWRTMNGTDWEPVTTNGNLGGLQNRYGNAYMWSMAVFDDHLLIGTFNPLTGCEIWASESGAPNSFRQINISGMESGRNKVETVYNDETYYRNEQYGARTFAIFQDKLYVGTATWALHADLVSLVFGLANYWHSSRVGCEVWRIDHL